MDELSEGVERGLSDGFRKRRMRMDRQIDFFDCVLVLTRYRQLVNQLGGVRADNVGAQNLAVLGVADDLTKPSVSPDVRARPLRKGNADL